jgi:hypothetical protein
MKSTKLASTVMLLSLLLLLVIQPGVAQEEEPPYRLYLPLVLRPETLMADFTAAHSWGLYSRGANLEAAQQATDVSLKTNDISMFAWNTGEAPPWSPQYTLTRGCVTFDLTTAPAGVIAEAALELYPWTVMGPVDIEIWQGTWSGEAPTAADWDARGELLATVHFTNTPASPLWVRLDLSDTPVPAALKLLVRGDESTPMAAFQTLGASFLLRDPEYPEALVSKLHLWIIP